MNNKIIPSDCFQGDNTGNDAKQSNQDLLNSVTLNNDLKHFIVGKTPDEATLDLLLEYPETAKDWLIKAALHIHDLEVCAKKSKAMKPKLDGLDDQDIILCPACGDGLIAADDPDYLIPKYCSECGQLLQWNEDLDAGTAKSDHEDTLYVSQYAATAKDFLEAWKHIKSFLSNPNKTFLTLTMDSEYTSSGYTIVKLPYGNDIYLLYGIEAYHAALSPAFDLKYAGFYKRKSEQTYNIREPLNRFFGFEGNPISESSLKSMLIEAIQKTVADYIAVHAEEFSGIPITVFDDDIAGDAEKAFSKKEAHLDFHKKITVSDWSISDRDMVQFIDDPDSLLKRKAEERMKGHEEELARFWVAHCASQKILDQLFAETTQDFCNKQS